MLNIQTWDSLACQSKGYGTPMTVTSVGLLFKEVMGPVFNVDTYWYMKSTANPQMPLWIILWLYHAIIRLTNLGQMLKINV